MGAALVEAASCKDEDVFVVGGANSAGQAALHFAKFACKVTMLVRGEGLSATMSKYLIDEIERTSQYCVEAENAGAFGGRRRAAGDAATERSRRVVSRAGHFAVCVYRRGTGNGMAATQHSAGRERVFAGRAGFAHRWQVAGTVAEPREPFLLESSVPGVFVAGDVRHGSIKRVASAVGEGSIAVQFAHQYLAGF